MTLVEKIYAKAKKLNCIIALPEGEEERNLKAAVEIVKQKLARIVLLGDESKIKENAKKHSLDLTDIEIQDPKSARDRDSFVQELVSLRKDKGMTLEKAKELLNDSLYYAAMMVKNEKAAAYVSGAVHSTGDVLRPALQIIKTAPGCKTVSSFFIMVLPSNSPYASVKEELFFADCAVVPSPTEEQLADIAMSTVASYRSLIPGSEPKLAMLSFSTKGSAKHPDVEKVIKSVEIIRERDARLSVDGELQADAALIEKVGTQKAPGSNVAGKANILVFPDLNSGNIAYKLVQRLAGAAAIGPIVQGLAKPVNDLSRGCSVQDIVDTVAVTACQTSS